MPGTVDGGAVAGPRTSLSVPPASSSATACQVFAAGAGNSGLPRRSGVARIMYAGMQKTAPAKMPKNCDRNWWRGLLPST